MLNSTILAVRGYTNRRRSPRVNHTETVQLWDDTGHVIVANASIHDVSHSGVGITLERRIDIGAVLTVRSERLFEKVTVRHCTPIESAFLIGCECHHIMIGLWF